MLVIAHFTQVCDTGQRSPFCCSKAVKMAFGVLQMGFSLQYIQWPLGVKSLFMILQISATQLDVVLLHQPNRNSRSGRQRLCSTRRADGSRPPAGSRGEERTEGGGCSWLLNFQAFEQRLIITRPARLQSRGRAA